MIILSVGPEPDFVVLSCLFMCFVSLLPVYCQCWKLVHSRVCVFCNVLSRRGQLMNFDLDLDLDWENRISSYIRPFTVHTTVRP